MFSHFLTTIRSHVQSPFRRSGTYLLGADDRSNDDNSTCQQRIFLYWKSLLGPNLQVALFTFLLFIFLLFALSSQAHESVGAGTSSFELNNHAHFLLNTTIINSQNSTSATDHRLSTDNGRPSPNGWLYMMFAMFAWVWMLQSIRRCRDNAIRRNAIGGSADGLRMLNQLMQLDRGRMAGMTTRMRMALLQRDFTGDDYEMLQLLDSEDFLRLTGGAPVSRGITDPIINTFPVHRVSEEEVQEDTRNGHCQCNVCLGPYEPGEEVRTLPCLHKYHKQCIDPWLRSNAICPICKCAVVQRDSEV